MKITFFENLLVLIENNPAVIGSVCTLLSAACAAGMLITAVVNIVFHVKEIKIQKEHNRAMLRPKCDIVCSEAGGIIKISLYNYGHGTMMIDHLEITNKETGSVVHNAYEMVPDTIGLSYYSLATKGRDIAVNGHIKLIEINKKRLTREKYSKLRNALSKYTINVFYQDICGEGPCLEAKKDLADLFAKSYR